MPKPRNYIIRSESNTPHIYNHL
uniref:Uncharacterized protein n=1 Tax=Lepeophtheirus salmonis TaxID=72036 RepID=A0A0K2TZR5_LEPSM